ncbi:MAG: cupin domain-containing protein [Polyangia bacterium]
MSKTSGLSYLAPNEGKLLRVGPYGFSFKAGRASGSNYTVAEVTVPAGMTNALHRHPCEETMYVLAGEFEFFSDDGERRRVGVGGVVHVPSRVAHGYVNRGDSTGRLLLVAPAPQEGLFDDLAEASALRDPARIADVFARHQVETFPAERS